MFVPHCIPSALSSYEIHTLSVIIEKHGIVLPELSQFVHVISNNFMFDDSLACYHHYGTVHTM